jgi:glycosyltransferase involved in cell wall biosynthesis
VYSSRFGLGRYVRAILRHQATLPLDVLLACDAYWAGHVARLVGQVSRVPYVVCSHGSDIMHGSRFLTRPVTRQRLGWAIRDAAAVACISSYMRQRTEEVAQPQGIVRLVLNGWPDEWSHRPASPRRVAAPYLLAMGRVVELKGFQTLVEAFARIRPRHPQVSLVIAGDGNYLPQLVDQAERLGLHPAHHLPAAEDPRPTVCFPGFVHGDEKLSLLQHAALAVSPSIRQEPMSLVLYELLCCGVPVIGSRVGGTPDIVKPGINGELFAAGDAAELAGILGRLLENPASRDRLASQAGASVEPYRWGRIAQAYLDLFGDVVDGGRAGSCHGRSAA